MNEQKQLTPEEMMGKIDSFEKRLSQIEVILKIKSIQGTIDNSAGDSQTEQDEEVDLLRPFSESRIFEYGLAWLGSAVLLLGMIFMMAFVDNNFGGIVSCLLGLAAAALTFVLSNFIRKTLTYMSNMFTLSGHMLIYYSLLKLHFFSTTPVFVNQWSVVGLLIIAIGVMFYLAVKSKSEIMAVIAYLLLIATGLFADNTNFTLSLFVLSTATAIYLFDKQVWKNLLILSIFVVYIAHTLWLIGNPVIGHPLGAFSTHQNNIIFLFLYGALYSLVSMIKSKGRFSADIFNATIIINGLAFSLLLFLITLTFYSKNYIWIFLTISILCLIYSIILHYRIDRKFDSSFYANFSFMALSIAAYGYSSLPGSYFYLGWQSLVVLAIAIWFKSNLIVKMNTLLYAAIFIAYLFTTTPIGYYNVSFTLIPIISVGILTWKKDWLELKTDMIRNIYLVMVFFAMLYMLYFAVPNDYVTISWGLAAVFYIALSGIFRNTVYRWMAILTLAVTVVYLFIYDLPKMALGYRIVAFICLGLIILGVSFYYTKKLKKGKEETK